MGAVVLVPLGSTREGSSPPEGEGGPGSGQLSPHSPAAALGAPIPWEASRSWGAQSGVQAGWVLAAAPAVGELSVPVLCSDLPSLPPWSWGLGCGRHKLCCAGVGNCGLRLPLVTSHVEGEARKEKLEREFAGQAGLSQHYLAAGRVTLSSKQLGHCPSAGLSLPSRGSCWDSQGSLPWMLLGVSRWPCAAGGPQPGRHTYPGWAEHPCPCSAGGSLPPPGHGSRGSSNGVCGCPTSPSTPMAWGGYHRPCLQVLQLAPQPWAPIAPPAWGA